MATSSAPGMLRSAAPKPSRTCTRACLPSWRMRRCSARPLPSASPSGLRCEVMRKLRPARMRSATCCAPRSGFIAGRILFQQRLDAAGERGGVVVSEVELRSVAKANAPAEERADAAAALLQRVDGVARLIFVQAADEDARDVEVGADFDFGDGGQAHGDILEVEAEYFDQGVANVLAHSRSSARLSHRSIILRP